MCITGGDTASAAAAASSAAGSASAAAAAASSAGASSAAAAASAAGGSASAAASAASSGGGGAAAAAAAAASAGMSFLILEYSVYLQGVNIDHAAEADQVAVMNLKFTMSCGCPKVTIYDKHCRSAFMVCCNLVHLYSVFDCRYMTSYLTCTVHI